MTPPCTDLSLCSTRKPSPYPDSNQRSSTASDVDSWVSLPAHLQKPSTIRIGNCINHCASRGYKYAAGLEGDSCQCSSEVQGAPMLRAQSLVVTLMVTLGTVLPEASCAAPCSGAAQEICGGDHGAASVYETGATSSGHGSEGLMT